LIAVQLSFDEKAAHLRLEIGEVIAKDSDEVFEPCLRRVVSKVGALADAPNILRILFWLRFG
jgi:hypothetical protein